MRNRQQKNAGSWRVKFLIEEYTFGDCFLFLLLNSQAIEKSIKLPWNTVN